ncbi:solute carrier organic anion transporter family member 1A4-like [Asterias amurensis]|uniref:solute carrier organic anion transporter family member 1A4-like n=1 Tax=Asterias amurensis TaxID=7602 RepID=UPI003AB223E6
MREADAYKQVGLPVREADASGEVPMREADVNQEVPMREADAPKEVLIEEAFEEVLLNEADTSEEIEDVPLNISDEDLPEYEDGSNICSFIPKWLQPFFLSPIFFLVCVCLGLFGDAVAVGAFSGITTTIESRFRFTASNLAFIVMTYSIGNIVALPFVSYFAGRPKAKRPIWIANGILVMGIGIFMSGLPQFLFDKLDIVDGKTESIVCMNDTQDDQCHKSDAVNAQNDVAFWVLNIGSVVWGVGYACIPAIALSYIDDNCKTETTALSAGIMSSMYGVGSMIGYFLSSFVLTLWVDFYRLEPGTTLPSPEHPAWVGAWWLGLLICGGFVCIASLPVYGFPRKLPKRSRSQAPLERNSTKDGTSAKIGSNIEMKQKGSRSDYDDRVLDHEFTEEGPVWGFLKTSKRLLTNPVFMSITSCMSCQFAISFGFTTFFAKYLESQFEVNASNADLLTGVTLVPAYGVGWILGGVIVRKAKLGFVSMFVFAFSCILLAVGGYIFSIFFGCSNPHIAGVNYGYLGQSNLEISLVADCNVNCGCTTASYQPVCDETNDIIYISACLAGCNDTINDMSYYNCSCLAEGIDSTKAGLCEFDCNMLVPFIIVQILQTMAVTMAGVPQTILLLRFVEPEDKTSALGLNHFFTGVGGLVGPLVYAAVVDLSCTLWQSVCDSKGSCLVYDIELYRRLFMGLSMVIGIMGALFILPSYYFIKKTIRERPEKLDENYEI